MNTFKFKYEKQVKIKSELKKVNPNKFNYFLRGICNVIKNELHIEYLAKRNKFLLLKHFVAILKQLTKNNI